MKSIGLTTRSLWNITRNSIKIFIKTRSFQKVINSLFYDKNKLIIESPEYIRLKKIMAPYVNSKIPDAYIDDNDVVMAKLKLLSMPRYENDSELSNMMKKLSKPNLSAKEEIIRRILSDLLPESKYYLKGGITRKEAEQSRFYDTEMELEFEDLILGKLSGFNFRLCDVINIKYYNNTKIEYYTSLFEFDFNRTFSNDVVIVKKYKRFKYKGYLKLKTLNKDFNKIYDVYALKKYDSLLILTPHVMEHLLKIKNSFDLDVEMSFINSKMFLVFYGLDIFEIKSYYTGIINQDDILHFKKQLKEIEKLITILNEKAFI